MDQVTLPHTHTSFQGDHDAAQHVGGRCLNGTARGVPPPLRHAGGMPHRRQGRRAHVGTSVVRDNMTAFDESTSRKGRSEQRL